MTDLTDSERDAIKGAIWSAAMESTAWMGWTDNARKSFVEMIQNNVLHVLAQTPATEARIEKGLIDGVEVDFLIENPPATGARLGRFIERMRELGQAMPPNAVSMEIQKALREFEVKG